MLYQLFIFFMLFMLRKNQIDFYTFLARRGTKYIVPLPRFLRFLLVIAKGKLYIETSLQQTSFIVDTFLQRTLFSGMDEMMVKVSQQNLSLAHALWQTPLYSGNNFSVPIHINSRIDLSIEDTPNSRSYKTVLLRNLYRFCFRQYLQLHVSFLQSLLFYYFNNLFRSIKIINSKGLSVCIHFHG